MQPANQGMRPEGLAIALRRRSPWEAMDLGFTMLRRWWKPVYVAHAVVFVPLNLALLKGCSIVGVFYGAFRSAEPARYAELRDELVGWLGEGRIRPTITTRLPLECAALALQLVGSRRAIGKILLTTALGRAHIATGEHTT